MQIPEERLNDFLYRYFLFRNYQSKYEQKQLEELNNQSFTLWGIDLKIYKSPTSNFPKSIKDYGFTKKYETICAFLPYVSGMRPQQLQTQTLLTIINDIYSCYLKFIKNGLWKTKQFQSHLQIFFLLYLHQYYSTLQVKIKRKYNTFDRFLLNVFYTISILKSFNKQIKNFSNFLNASYSFGELFLYVCMKNLAVQHNCQQMVNSGTLRKILKIFQSEDQSQYISITLSKDSINMQQDKLVSINSLFLEPIGGCLPLSKVKMYKIMKVCKIIVVESQSQLFSLTWNQFLKMYFELVQNNNQPCFQHIVSAQIVKFTYEISKRLLQDKCQQTQEQFLEDAFSYIFQILELIFSQNLPSIQDKKTLKNIENLRKHYEYMKILSQCNVAVINKFSKKILKNNYILQLFKKYSQVQFF